MRALCLLVALVALATGCTSTHAVAPDAAGFAHANRTLADQTVTLTLADGRRVSAQSLRFAADTTTWIDPATGALQRTATAEIGSTERVRRGRGAWQGALLAGLGTAVVMSAVVAADVQDSDWGTCGGDQSGLGCAKPLFAVGMGTMFGAMATIPGAAAGALIGSRQRIEVLPGPPVARPASATPSATPSAE